MPISCCALTATVGDPYRADLLVHPCFQPHFAPNHGANPTLHDYHPSGEKVNAHSARVGGGSGSPELGQDDGSVRAAGGDSAESFDRHAGQLPDMRLTFRVLDFQRGGRAVA